MLLIHHNTEVVLNKVFKGQTLSTNEIAALKVFQQNLLNDLSIAEKMKQYSIAMGYMK